MLAGFVWVVIVVGGIALGVYLGMPGRYNQTVEDIDAIMDAGGRRRRKVKKRFTPLAWIQRQASAKKSRERGRRGFSVKSPDEE